MQLTFPIISEPIDSHPPLGGWSWLSLPFSGENDFKIAESAKCWLCTDTKNGWTPLVDGDGIGRCFFQGVFLTLPSFIAILFTTAQLLSLRSKRHRTFGTLGWQVPLKLALIALQCFIWLWGVSGAYNEYGTFADVGTLSPLLAAIALVPVSLLTFAERFLSDKPSGSLLVYWLTLILTLVLNIWQGSSPVALTLVSLVSALISFVLEWASPRFRDKTRDDPFDQADIFSRLTFTWMTPLMKLGYSHYLVAEDLPNLARSDRTDKCIDDFERSWKHQVDKRRPSLIMTLFGAFGNRYFIGGVCKFIQDCMQFAQPQLLRLLIAFVNDYNSPDSKYSLSRGFYIAFAMFFVAMMQTMALHQYFERSFGTGMRVRVALTHAIFRKSLVLSGESRGERTTGDTLNLMSIDTMRIQDMCPNGHNLWSSPLQITLCLVSLYSLVGNSMWVGVVILILMVPVNTRFAATQKRLQSDQMKYKDLRTRLTSELLSSIKSIKLYAWEKPFTERLEHARNNLELTSLKKIGVFQAAISYIWSFTPVLVSASTFACYTIFQKQSLTTEIVFPALSLFNLLSFPMAMFPMLLSSMIEASVATARIQDYLLSEELQSDAVEHLPRAEVLGDNAVEIKDADFVWQKSPVKPALNNINLSVNKGELYCIVGRVGSGKSAILQSILGNIVKTKGSVSVHGSIAYVAQQPWILNATVKENILFGCKYDEAIYEETINACALREDLDSLPDGDDTLVGEKGISLSGGQKSRISLARAVYARADVYLLDDPLSAVDEHVGRHIIDNVLSKSSGLLATKAIILATNSIPVLRNADKIAMVVDGEVVESGSISEVSTLPKLNALLEEFGRHAPSPSTPSSTIANQSPSPDDVSPSSGKDGDTNNTTPAEEFSDLDEPPQVLVPSGVTPKPAARRASMRRPSLAPLAPANPAELRKEHVEQGKVSWNVYAEYARVSGMSAVGVFIFTLTAANGLSLVSNVWLKHWAEVEESAEGNSHLFYYLGMYFGLGVVAGALMILQNLILWLKVNMRSARILHENMLHAVIRAPMSFFETTPLGRIVNRFSNDVYRVDQQLARVFLMLFNNVIRVSFTIAIICWNTPSFLAVALPLAFFYFYYQRFYLRTSRELKRLDSVSRSPIYAQFQEALDGVATIRAFGATDRFSYLNQCYIDSNNKAYFPSISANRWLAVRLEFVGSVVILSAAALSVASLPYGRLNAGLIGLALSYALQVTQSLNWIVRMTVEVETNIVSVERMMEYSELTPEAPLVLEGHRPSAEWPEKGAVKFSNYSTRYRSELPLVLKNIDLDIRPGEKIGIVGRTGAGKSSLTLALFRLIEPSGGHIDIDSINSSEIGLFDLRSHLSIIPQDSQLFEGTIRDNLDPRHVATDAQLWQVLEHSHLKGHVSAMDGCLDAVVAEGGSNLSSGQRQLLCLSRALLTDSKILVMDEATAAVDVETDQIVQQVIRKEFKNRTILTIAHRINTILDSDRVIVLNAGEVSEFAPPQELLENPDSRFYALAKRGGLVG